MPTSDSSTSSDGTITWRREGDDVHVVLTGAVDMTTDAALADSDVFATDTAGAIVVDASGVTFVDSIGLSMLLRLRHHGGQGVRLVRPSDSVVRILELTGTESLFTIE